MSNKFIASLKCASVGEQRMNECERIAIAIIRIIEYIQYNLSLSHDTQRYKHTRACCIDF